LDYEIFSATGDGPFTRSAFTQSTSVVNWLATPHTRRGVRGQAPDSRDDSP